MVIFQVTYRFFSAARPLTSRKLEKSNQGNQHFKHCTVWEGGARFVVYRNTCYIFSLNGGYKIQCVSKNVPSLTGYSVNKHPPIFFYNFWHMLSAEIQKLAAGITFPNSSWRMTLMTCLSLSSCLLQWPPVPIDHAVFTAHRYAKCDTCNGNFVRSFVCPSHSRALCWNGLQCRTVFTTE